MNTRRSHLGAALVLALLTCATAACSSSAEADKPAAPKTSTYQGEALTLTIGTDDSPGVPSADQITYFADQVAELSDGRITIEPRWHAEGEGHATDWDQAVAAMVQRQELDLALGPTWAWDVLGVTSLRPLQSPFLVDSDALVATVVQDDDLAGQLMSGLGDAGVVGLSMWPEGLRHPFGFDEALIGPEDYAGRVIRSSKSRASTDLFKALGAGTTPAEPNAETMDGMQGEFVLSPNGIATANVTFFPKVNLLYANADVYAALDDQAVGVLAEAAVKTRTWAIEHASDVDAGTAFCAGGGTVVTALASDVEALRNATAPAAEAIAESPGNQAVVEAISDLKKGTDTVVTADACSGEKLARHKPGKAEAALNGTYRFTITVEDFAEAGRPENQAYHNAGTQTFTLQDGNVHVRLDPTEHEFGQDSAGADESDGTYQVDADAITFFFPSFNEEDRMIFEVGSDGDLTMRPLDFPNSDVEFLMTSQVWEKVG